MVFLLKSAITGPNMGGPPAPRDTGKSVALLVIESLFGTLVAFSNIIFVSVMIAGGRKLMKNDFYIIVANLIFFTSLKAFVELGFILPYYIMRNNDEKEARLEQYCEIRSHIPKRFRLSVTEVLRAGTVLDYESHRVLFFSLLIAINRLTAVLKASGRTESSKLKTIVSCLVTHIASLIIPLMFHLGRCQFAYSSTLKMYYNTCNGTSVMGLVVNCLVYLSYTCTVAVLLIYFLVFVFLRRKRRNSVTFDMRPTQTSVQMKLLKQSVVVFVLYAASILAVIIISFVPQSSNTVFDIAYVENLLNLSIAGVYPICFLAMSGEMKGIIVARLLPPIRHARQGRVASISLNNSPKKIMIVVS